MKLSKGLFSVDQLSKDDIKEIVDRAQFFKKRYRGKDKLVGGLNGMTVINMFFEPSTRTRISFELASKRLGAQVVNVIADASAMVKGETRADTMLTLNAMSPDAIIMRTSENNMPYDLSVHTNAAIINAGDGTNEHPTQALLDYFTIIEESYEPSIAIVGDIIHSRVARSNIKLLINMGYEVMLVGPTEWMPNITEWVGEERAKKVSVLDNLNDALTKASVIMALRVQKERFSDLHRGLPDLKDYNEQFGIKNGMLTGRQILMHPGPVNRGVEIDDDYVYCPNSVILNQVENGVAIRSALLEYILR